MAAAQKAAEQSLSLAHRAAYIMPLPLALSAISRWFLSKSAQDK